MAQRQSDFTSDQPDLFQHLETPALAGPNNAPPLDLERELIGAMCAAMREARRLHGWGRDQIVDRMNLCLDGASRVTRRQLDAWMAASKEYHRAPAAWLPAFCWATQCLAPLHVLLHPLGLEAADARDQHALRLGQINLTRAQLAREERALRAKLGG